MSDSFKRRMAILKMLPRGGDGITIAEIEGRLKKDQHEFSTRTVQRDLNALSEEFPLVDANDGRAKRWSFMKNSHDVLLPSMDLETALTLKLAQQHLQPLIPQRVRDFLTPYYPAADKVLNNHTSGLGKWADSVRAISLGLQQQTPQIAPDVFEELSKAIAEKHLCEVVYRAVGRSSAKTYRISPLALVIRGPVTYLLAVYEGYSDIRQMALHRFASVRTLFDKAQQPEDFDLDRYIAEDHFGILQGDGELHHLVLQVDQPLARILEEAPLADDQQITQQDDGIRLSVSLRESWDLYRWLLSHSMHIRVESPLSVREQLQRYLQQGLGQQAQPHSASQPEPEAV